MRRTQVNSWHQKVMGKDEKMELNYLCLNFIFSLISLEIGDDDDQPHARLWREWLVESGHDDQGKIIN